MRSGNCTDALWIVATGMRSFRANLRPALCRVARDDARRRVDNGAFALLDQAAISHFDRDVADALVGCSAQVDLVRENRLAVALLPSFGISIQTGPGRPVLAM